MSGQLLKMKKKPTPIRELTRAEEQVMKLLWEKGKALINDLLSGFPEPKPAYNTVSTIIRILEQKGFVDHKAYGRTYEYFPIVSKKEYTRFYYRNFLSGYFGNSFTSLASFFASEEQPSLQDLEEIRKLINEEIKKKKDHE